MLVLVAFLIIPLAVIGAAIATIWALNTLFGVGIPYGMWEILAMIVLLMCVSGPGCWRGRSDD